jgi:UDP-2-acetamido-2,6-beta-L-arabino-hexul-4-ose reductase
MKVLVTGANGFIGKNLIAHLKERKDVQILIQTKADSLSDFSDKIKAADFIFHLAGINRPLSESEFKTGNSDFTAILSNEVLATGRQIPIVFSSSIQAERDNLYGKSKRDAEDFLKSLSQKTGNPIFIYRLPNVFGKWCRPNYNSVVATFCYNIAHDLPIQVNDPNAPVQLVYIDDVVSSFLKLLDLRVHHDVEPIYNITVGQLSDQLRAFKDKSELPKTDLARALYSTYISYVEETK